MRFCCGLRDSGQKVKSFATKETKNNKDTEEITFVSFGVKKTTHNREPFIL